MNQQEFCDALSSIHGTANYIGIQFTIDGDGNHSLSFNVRPKNGPMFSIPIENSDVHSLTVPQLLGRAFDDNLDLKSLISNLSVEKKNES